MHNELSLRQWQDMFNQGEFDNPSFETQVKAGWYDWFCDQKRLHRKTKFMGSVLTKLKSTSKLNLDSLYVFFKNNCPGVGRLYDCFKLCDLSTGEVKFDVEFFSNYGENKFEVFGAPQDDPDDFCFLFGTDDLTDLTNWLNKPW